MDNNKVINIYNMINNIEDVHLPLINSNTLDPDTLLT